MQDYPEIYLKDLSLVIGRQVILRGINTRFTGGKIYGLIGHNGSGKTMLMKCICGFVRPTAGGVRINGKWLGLEQDFPESLGALIEASPSVYDNTVLIGTSAGIWGIQLT